MYNIKKIIAAAGIVASSFLGLSATAHAGQVSECLQFDRTAQLEDSYITYIHASAGSFSKCVGNSQFQSEGSNPHYSKIIGLLQTTTGFRREINAAVKEAMEDAGRQAANASGVSFRGASGSVTGDITITLQGTPAADGTLQLSISGFDINGRVDLSYLSFFNFKATANFRGINIAATYNIYSGKMELQDPTFTSRVTDVDASGWGNLLIFLEPLAESKVDSMVNNAVDAYIERTVSANKRTLFSLDARIPDGEFINPFNGVDLGQSLKDQLGYFVNNVFVSVSVGGASLDNTYAYIQMGNLRVTAGRKLFRGFGYNCPLCVLP